MGIERDALLGVICEPPVVGAAELSVKVDGAAAPFFEKGKAFYYERRGQLDMGCNQCHDDNAGNMIRADTLSQGQGNGFPTYRLKWQKRVHCTAVSGAATNKFVPHPLVMARMNM